MIEQGKNPLSRITIKGFKSIKNCDLELGNINVLIGSNGAGKSNFISVFELMRNYFRGEIKYFGESKGVSTLFYNGTKVTANIEIETYYDQFYFKYDVNASATNELTAHVIQAVSESVDFNEDGITWKGYHFHDTSPNARIKSEHNISNSKTLQWDASNLAAFLYRLRKHHFDAYKNILKAVQMIAPYFRDFELEPNEGNKEHIVLRWQKKGCEDIFNASQLSDGTLRFICLATLLLQPTELQPATIIIDEPELGLHPFAITIFAEMVKKAAVNKQIILATQSVELLDHFDVEDVVVVDYGENGSEFKRLNAEELAIWIEEEYTLGELWNKNIFGGRP